MIAGTLRGRSIRAPKGTATRPTTDRVRESLFNLLGPLPAGARVLDLYAGSGALGIEAISRGAAHATFVEHGRMALRTLRTNLEALDLARCTEVVPGDVTKSSVWSTGPYDLVLADPPYDSGGQEGLLERVAQVLRPGGLAALETSSRHGPPAPPESLAIWKSRRYGDTEITVYLRTPEESP